MCGIANLTFGCLLLEHCIQVPFFSDEEETPSTPKADAVFVPRENPRALVIRPMDQWPSRASAEKAPPLKDASTVVYENGKVSELIILKVYHIFDLSLSLSL